MSFTYASRWVPLREAAAELGCSLPTIWRLRASGILLRGVHWHRSGPGRRAPVMLNVEGARLALQVWCSR